MADAKRRFADVLGAVRHGGERFIIERNGTPMAALVPISELQTHAESHARGFLALVGAFDDAPEFADAVSGAVDEREAERSRPAPVLDE